MKYSYPSISLTFSISPLINSSLIKVLLINVFSFLILLITFSSALKKSCDYPAPYTVTYPATDQPKEPEVAITYTRDKCTTCCKVLFASDYDVSSSKLFTDQDDLNNHTRFVMDMEFDLIDYVRQATGSYEQCILLRPIKPGNDLQYWEFYAYKMYVSYPLPKRVHDIRGGANIGSKLIIWKKKPPLEEGTKNQRFVYVHPYADGYNLTAEKWGKYPKHFYLPFSKSTDMCYEFVTNEFQTWSGNAKNQYSSDVYQIKAANCAVNEPKQIFTPVFA